MPTPRAHELHPVSGPLRVVALGDYHRYWLDQSRRIKNPAFDTHSRQVLNLKDVFHRDFDRAVAYFSRELIGLFRPSTAFVKAELLIVPSHAKGTVSYGLVKIVQAICTADRRFAYRAGALHRTKTISKLASGGDRSSSVHHNSIEFVDHPRAPLRKFIIDDVCTTGHSMGACADVVRQVVQTAPITGIVLGKTVDE